MFTLRAEKDCLWDIVTLGEIMIRLDPGEDRVRTTRSFRVWEGGGEYNVGRGLRRCFGKRAAAVTAIVDNEVGRLLEDLMLQGGVDLRYVKWVPFDGIGKTARNGLNFTERGFGVRAAKGCSDRGHSATSQLKTGDIDWQRIFGQDGSRWFHTGGIFAALSATTPEVALEAMQSARQNGTIVSFDLNYRPSLWKSHGGEQKAMQVNREMVGLVDVLLGNEEDFKAALGYETKGVDQNLTELSPESYQEMVRRVVKDYPNLKVVATTLRNAKTATANDWNALLYYNGEFFQAAGYPDLEIMDRVGGGDSFASGLIYGIMAGKSPQECVDYGAAHGALAMTTPGDTSRVTLSEVEKTMRGGSARVDR